MDFYVLVSLVLRMTGVNIFLLILRSFHSLRKIIIIFTPLPLYPYPSLFADAEVVKDVVEDVIGYDFACYFIER